MNFYLTQVQLDLRELHKWAGVRNFGGRIFDEGLALHHLLGETFGPSVFQPFRLMPSHGARVASLFGHCEEDASTLVERISNFIEPFASKVINLSSVASQERPAASWKEGQRLGFDVRIRPTVRLNQELRTEKNVFKKGAELDAFLAKVLVNEANADREKVYFDWLSKQLEGAAVIECKSTRMKKFEKKKVVRNKTHIDGPDAIFQGTLSVVDPDKFAEKLAKGIGRHKTYGYGMILLRPPQF